MNELILSEKFIKFMKHKSSKVEVLEGQTLAGKTTVGAIKFIYKVIISPKRQHGICGLDIGTVEKNIINKDMGLLEFFSADIEYFPNGHGNEKLSHLYIHSSRGDKIVYIFGYNDTTKWKKALGGQLGCLYIDECNIADIDFIREAMMRCDYCIVTLNPDDPNLPIYSEYINHSRPLAEYVKDYPEELYSQLCSEKAYDGWVHWYFTMDDNAAATEEKKEQIRNSVPVGSKIYKNKILGLRGRSEGLVFEKFDRNKNVINVDFRGFNVPCSQPIFKQGEQVYQIWVGLDSGLNGDSTAATPICLTTFGRFVCLPSFYYEPRLGTNASSEQALVIEKWLDLWLNYFNVFNLGITTIVGDSAALTQTVLLELNKRTHYAATPVPQKDIQKDTIRAISIIEQREFVIVNVGYIDPVTYEKKGEQDMFIIELENKVWDKKKNVPEDGNDHCIDAFKYGSYYAYYGGAY